MGGKCDYNNSVEKFEQDSQSGPAPDRRINTMANCAIVGINWGDEGKGRMVDYLTDHYDVVVRYQGGGNAGHTVVNEKGKFALHLLPSGIFRDGVVNILGNGVALDCENLLKEMETLRAAGVIITPENLKVSDRASLLLPWHRELDALEEARLADKKYGSTKQGIAPFYGDKYQKKTVQAGELLHPEHLKEHLADLLEWKNLMLQKIYGAKGYTMDELMAWVNTYCGAIKPYITDTGRFLRNAQKEGKSILFEAQLGALRDLDYGIYPYTTSSNAVAAYAPVGSGLPTAKLDEVVGVVKAYSSCVGEGPFVCEWFGEGAQQLRDAGAEYGAKTGRPRRVGPIDLVATRYGVETQGATNIALTKLDVLSYMDKIPVCAHYELNGEQTDDFPEFTGRVCPALCEKSCVLKLSCDEPVTIRENEAAIVEAAFREGYVQPIQPVRNGKKVAVIGSGPAGLTVANQLNRKGYEVTVFEKDELPGGLLRFGIPNFKLGKHIIDRRIRIMEQEGILFRVNTMVGKEILAKDVVKDFDAVCVAIGAEVPRDLSIEGRHLRGVHFALELLSQQNRILEGIPIPPKSQINCKGKKVLVIGGGDTGSDCVGTANRHGAACVTQIEIMPQPPVGQNPATPWPMYPQVLKTSSSHEEGCIRRWNLASNRFIGEKNNLIGVEVEEVEWAPSPDGGRPQMRQTGKKEIIEADLVFLAMGFLHPEQEGLIKELRLATDNRDNIAVDNAGYTANSNLFACGDAVSGASLVVKAMASGRNVARSIDRFLQTN